MGELIITILLFFVVIVLTAVLFFGWVIYSVVRGIFRAIAAILGIGRPLQAELPGVVRCAQRRCQAENPAVARFCRRCGRPLQVDREAPVSRAAIW